MTPKRRLLPLLTALLVWGNLNSSNASTSSSSAAPDSSSAFPPTSSPTRTPAPSGVIIDEAGARRTSSGQTESREKTRVREPPGSPVNLFMPDEFQFYTLNANGQLVMKQMTKQEIQGMIAAGGGGTGLPVDLGHHQTQLPVGEPKVSDVVENVQKVLKDELNKPIQVPVSESSIPGSVNSEWTNMLPYILSGGSVDQQDIAQDTSIILPTLDADQSYVNVVPLHSGKPEPETNYIPVQPSNEQEIKFATPKPAMGLTGGKPISLLGNMALDSDILEEHEIYSLPTKSKPSRPTSTPTYHKYTTTRPSLTSVLKDNAANLKNSSSNKPTLYIPLAVSSSLLADTQNQDNYGQTGNLDVHIIPEYISKPTQQEKNTSKLPNSEIQSTTVNTPPKKSTTYAYSDETGYTRVPMIQVPVITADKISSSTQRTNQQQTPMFEILPTISPGSITSTTTKEGSHPSKINMGPMGGFKKPDISHKPSTQYRPMYEPTIKSTTASILSASSYHPVYEPAAKPSTINIASPTYRPIYEPITRPSTVKPITSTYRPIYEPMTKPSADIISSPTYRPVYEKETTVTHKPTSFRPVYETVTIPSERFKVTQYPSTMYTTGKASTVTEMETKFSTPSGVKVTKYPLNMYQTYTKEKDSSLVTESVTKPSVKNSTLEVTKSPDSVQTVKNEEIDTSLVYVQRDPNFEKQPVISASQTKENEDNTFKTVEKINVDGYLSINDSAQVNKSESSTESDITDNYDHKTVLYPDTTFKLSEKTSYPADKETNNLYDTTIPDKIEVESETSTLVYYSTEKSTQSFATNIDQESLKTEGYTIYEDSSVRPTVIIQSQDSKTENSNYNTLIQELSTKEPDSLFKQTDGIPAEVTETIIPNYEISTVKTSANVNKQEEIDDIKYIPIAQKDTTEGSFEETTMRFVPLDESTTEYYTLNYDSSDKKKVQKKPILISSYKEPTVDMLETTFVPLKDSTTYKIEITDSTKDYSTPIDLIANPSNDKLNTKNPGNLISESDNISTKQPDSIVIKENDALINTSSIKDTDKITISTNNYVTKPTKGSKPTTEPLEKENSSQDVADTTNNYQSVKLATEKPSKSTIYSIISTLEKDYNQNNKNLSEYTDVTPLYEKMETIKANTSNMEGTIVEITPSTKENEQKEENKTPAAVTDNIESAQEEEMSTVKVIPVYDDDTLMYTLPSDTSSKTTFGVTSTLKPSNEIKSTESNFIPNTDLPGLQETFNIYMKEHYDSKLSTTDNYDEISHFTTFPAISIKDSLYHKKYLPSSPSATSEFITTNIPEYEKTPQKSQLNAETTIIMPNYQNTESSGVSSSTPKLTENIKKSTPEIVLESTTESTAFKEISTNKSEYEITKDPSINNKNNAETPFIYSESTSSLPDKQNISHSTNEEHMNNNASLTKLETKNPIADVDKIISEAPAYTNTPSTVHYTLPVNNQMANNIASGLIAGYPTYSQAKPITEYITSTASHETSSLSTTEDPMLFTTEEYKNNTTQKYNIDQEKPIIPSFEEEKNAEKISSGTFNITSEDTPLNESFEISNNKKYSPIPLESLSTNSTLKISSQTEGDDDQINSSFIPPLEKISDLINQLKNSPDDYSIATTIVPLDNFEAILNDSNPKTKNKTVTAMFENSSKTTLESQNNTYVILQTLPTSYTDKPSQNTKPLASSTSKIISSTVEIATQNYSKAEPVSDSTTAPTTLKQHVTEKPHTVSTYKTTAGLIEKVQSTIDKSAGRINLEEEKIKLQQIKPTEPTKFTMKNKIHYSTRKPVNEAQQSYTRKTTKPVTKQTTTERTSTERTTTTAKPTTEDAKEANTDKWTLIPQKTITDQIADRKKNTSNAKEEIQQPNSQVVPLEHSTGAEGLDQSNKDLDKDVAEFLNMCNELSFKFWSMVNTGLSSSRSLTVSPFGMISTLAMIFLGARGTTSSQMNDILKLDDVVTFNPHLVFQNITDTVTLARGQGIENAAFVKALFTDRLKVRRIMPFYKEQAQQFYEGAVVDINFSTAGDILRKRTNLLIRKQTGGRIKDFVKTHTVPLRSPLTALSANVFQTSCDGPDASSEGRDGEMYFAVAQTVKQRKLMPIPAVVWRSGVSAGYEPSLDATVVALGDAKRPVSLIMVMPGQQGVTAPGDNLDRLESRLFGNPSDTLQKLLKVVIPRRVELQMPKFSHRSIVNITAALKKMGFEPLFTKTADLKGINGAGHNLYLADMIQMNLFCTCGDDNKLGNRHLSETYPGTSSRHTRTWDIINNNTNNNNNNNNGVYDNLDNRESGNSESSESRCDDEESDDEADSDNLNDEVESNQQQSGKRDFDKINNLRQKLDKKRIRWFMPTGRRRCRNRRQAESEKPRMKIDKPFLYFIRHNLTGLILHIGRFNPKNQS